jgi:membrane protein DedA with SNARE-associated domain
MSHLFEVWVPKIMDMIGYLGIALLMFAENAFPPIPSELIMPLAGAQIAQGKMAWLPVITAGVLGTVLGSLIWYYIGVLVSEERLMAWADRYGKWMQLSGEDIAKSKTWFNRHGTKAVFFCRMVPGIRTLISLPAGIDRMPLQTYLIYTTLGTTLWTTLLTALGYVLGNNYKLVDQYLGPVSKWVVLILVVAFVAFVGSRLLKKKPV